MAGVNASRFEWPLARYSRIGRQHRNSFGHRRRRGRRTARDGGALGGMTRWHVRSEQARLQLQYLPAASSPTALPVKKRARPLDRSHRAAASVADTRAFIYACFSVTCFHSRAFIHALSFACFHSIARSCPGRIHGGHGAHGSLRRIGQVSIHVFPGNHIDAGIDGLG